ncbi:MAG: hypothetical protein M0Z54_13780 [Thermaerobacter sp.]|nr:hypothetical protein [Thermaerobacter sp.]
MTPGTDSTLLLVILAFIALTGLAGLALLGALVRLVLRLEKQLTTGLDEVRTELVATAAQVRTTSRQMGVVLGEVSRGARYALVAVELWRLWRHRTPAAAPAAVRRTLWTRVGIPLGVLAVKALAARRNTGPGGPSAPSA